LADAFPQLEILELIGQGGMGFVFKARQLKLERLVALKILPQTFSTDPAFAERFTREGRVLARLNHPNIVTIHDFGQANGLFYLLMEYVDGVNLRQAMRAGRFTPEQALAVVPKICDALQFAHNEGILHRDIKPENILLDAKGRVKIADFGIAKLIGQPHSDAKLTASGGTLGTPHYMAPEQIEKPAAVDHRADIYSLGVVFYEMLTGELPLGKFQPPSKKVEVDVRLDDVVLHALEKEPERRYQQASEVKTAVDTLAIEPRREASSSSRHEEADSSRTDSQSLLTSAATSQGKPDRFWRWFAVGVVAMVAAPVALAILAILAAIIIPNFVKARAAREEAQAAQAEATSRRAMALEQVRGGFQHAKAFQLRWVAREDETNSPADLLPDANDPTGQSRLRVLKEVLLDGAAVESAGFAKFEPDRSEITVLLTDSGGRRFADLTRTNIGRRLAIVWNGRVLSAPVIRDAITSRQVMVTGNFGYTESQLLVDVLNRGNRSAMAAKLEEERVRLAEMQTTRRDEHPDVIRQKAKIQTLENQLRALESQ
jgi:type II secretory pathway pseudopilin PulG/predicted Ser/Thr protein kinase